MSHFDVFCMSHPNAFQIEPEISAKVAHEFFWYFTYPIDVNVPLKMAVEYEIVIIISVNKVYQG